MLNMKLPDLVTSTPLIMDEILSMISSPHSQGGGVYESDYPSFLCVSLDRNGQKNEMVRLPSCETSGMA